MKFQSVITSTGEWLRGEGPHHQIVVSSRVRLARNLRNRAFPGWAKTAERLAIIAWLKPRAEEFPQMQDPFAEARLSHGLPDQRWHRNAGVGHAASARVGLERTDQSSDPGSEQNRLGRARVVRGRHGSDGKSFPNFQPNHARRKRGRDHRALEQ